MEGLIATEQSARKFAAWIDDNHPEEVDLAARNVNDEIVRILSKSLRRDKKLRQLSLCNNRITSGSCSIVADILRNNSNVTSLNLLYNSICSTASGNYDSQSFIHEFVETCNEMQNIRSVCGCSSFNNELVLASDDDKELSNVLLLGIDLRLDTDLISLRYRGSLGLSEIFESLRDNRSLVRGTFSCIQSGSGEFDLALITFLEHNLSAKTLQFAFTAIDQTDKSTISSAVESEAEFAKSIMLCIVRSMEKNLGVTCLQLDSWPRDRETLTGLVSMLRKNCTLLHLALFSSVLRTSDLEAIAGALEYNTTLRVLYINDRSCREHNNSGGRAPSGESSGSSSSSGGSVGKYLLTADVVYLLEAAAKKRKVPFIIR